MGWIRIETADDDVLRPLAANTVLGRGTTSTWRLGPPLLSSSAPTVPTSWLELRWTNPGWTWRELRGPVDHYSSSGRLLADTEALRTGAQLRGDSVVIELVDASAPTPMVVDVARQQVVTDPEDQVEFFGEQATTVVSQELLAEGALFIHGDRVYRYHVGRALPDTRRGHLDVRQPGFRLRIHEDAPGGPVVVVNGAVLAHESVGLLLVYIEARESGEDDGYLTAIQVRHRMAQRLGRREADLRGNLVCEWRRCLRNGLSGIGISGVKHLFESTGGGELHRIRVGPVASCFERVSQRSQGDPGS